MLASVKMVVEIDFHRYCVEDDNDDDDKYKVYYANVEDGMRKTLMMLMPTRHQRG